MKKGTKVFDCRYGHGEINGFEEDDSYPVKALFDNDINESYTIDGRSLKSGNEFLSLTEYNFFDGGFTAIDAEPPLEVGDMVYAWDSEDDSHLAYGKVTYIFSGGISVSKTIWEYASKEIPQWFIDANK